MGLQISGPGSVSSSGASAGKQTVWIPAGEMIARTTNGPASGTTELSTNKVMRRSLDFDPSTNEYAQLSLRMPEAWDLGDITAFLVWTAASGSGDVVWKIQAITTSDHDALDSAFGSARSVTDPFHGANELHQTAEFLPIPLSSPVQNDLVTFQIYRDAVNASDTLGVDAMLLGVVIIFTTLGSSETPTTIEDPFRSAVKLLLPLTSVSGTTDISNTPHTVNVNGGASITTSIADPWGSFTGVLDLNGSTDFLSVASSADFTYGLGDFTIEFWARPRAFNGGWNAGLWQHGWPGGASDLLYLNADGIGNKVAFAPVIGATTTALVLGSWSHIALSRISGVLKLFINGVEAGSSSATFNQNTHYQVSIGAYNPGGGGYFNGYFSNVRFTQGIGRYASDFAVPAAPFP